MLNDYQKGSIFGTVMVAVAFAASISTIPDLQRHPSEQPAASIKQNQQQRESFRDAATSDPIAVFTGALVFVGGIQALLFLWQLGLIRRSLVDAKESATAAATAAKAAQVSATAALSQATAAEDALVKRERPYIFVYNVSVALYDQKTKEFYVTYDVSNFGSMPAIIERASIGFDVTIDGIDIPRPLHLGEDHLLVYSPILAAGDRRNGVKKYLPAGMVIGTDAYWSNWRPEYLGQFLKFLKAGNLSFGQ